MGTPYVRFPWMVDRTGSGLNTVGETPRVGRMVQSKPSVFLTSRPRDCVVLRVPRTPDPITDPRQNKAVLDVWDVRVVRPAHVGFDVYCVSSSRLRVNVFVRE